MLSKAHAKINLSLDVIGKRDDGYHLLKMLMQTIDLYDLIEIKKIKKGIIIECDREYIPKNSRNLAYKAAELFLNKYNINSGVKINIIKNIPVAAGLAGGSTDAATVLKIMRDIFKPNINNEQLKEISLNIGADVPFCVEGGTALCEGIGEKITTIKPFKDKILVLVKPNFGVSTKDVYSNLRIEKIYTHPHTKKLIQAIEDNDLNFVAKNMKNVLENVTLRKYKTLSSIKTNFMELGALGTMMSGSGPSVFGLFDDMLKAQTCYDNLKEKYKEVFITRTI
ncbi:4-(cytidine 5'-diphospho)-2-C-methyl-D-erythritol kinase [Clostridium sp. Marseille-Q2269]|uniref:4-(cytidine 5'-diphospho)-2-C-methyl-D-erythritol kinase n=1 Tax=Clostridium sp. Marseille-Q2269 TaxID=2942205 RepID=UPI002074342F|nr:4-(cytidine 5'-diphospho)-2-C-methyl-D-erythritol kinase [Clostridium sp. Marseille-Q2269]